MRSSIEGLNQEIEGLVLKSATSGSDPDHPVEDKVNDNLYLQLCNSNFRFKFSMENVNI